MRIINSRDIMETIEMLTAENLDVRTVTMGISLLDCIDPDADKACEKIYNKITRLAGNLVSVVDGISAEYGIPIVNKRISVTPIAMLLGAAPDADPVQYAKTLDRAAKAVGVNFIGGFGALVHKGFSAGDKRLIAAIPRALAETDIVCSSVNIGSTKSGINMDAVKLMGEVVRETAELTKDNMCMGDAKLVVFCNAPEDNPFMAGAFHGAGEPDCEIHVGVSGPGAVRAALAKLPKDAPMDEVAELVKRTAFKITRLGQLVANLASERSACPRASLTCRWPRRPRSATVLRNILEEMGLESCGCCGTTACLALLNDAVKKGGVMASNHVGGLSGAFIPVSEDDGMIDAAELRQPDAGKAGGHDCGLLRRHRHGRHPGRHHRRGHQRPDRGRSRHRHGEQQDHRRARHPRHRPQGRRRAGLRRPAGPRAHHAHQPVQPRGHDPPRRPHPRPDAGIEELIAIHTAPAGFGMGGFFVV